MSASGISGKINGDKTATAGLKKFNVVNINSVFNGKPLGGQKGSSGECLSQVMLVSFPLSLSSLLQHKNMEDFSRWAKLLRLWHGVCPPPPIFHP